MPVFDGVRLWDDVLDEGMDELQAPELDYVFMSGPRYRVYSDPGEFFRRTLVTAGMLDLLESIVGGVGGRAARVYVLYSFFGGGKTHTLLTIYHALRAPEALLEAVEASARLMGEQGAVLRRQGERVVGELRRLGGVNVVVVSGKIEKLFPSPSRRAVVGGVEVGTLWGYIAASLGRYGVVEDEDRGVRVPGIDRLVRVFEGIRAVILVDELLEGIKTFYESGVEEDRRYASQLVSFIDNLLEAASRSSVVVVLTLPAERDERGGVQLESRYVGLGGLVDSLVRAIRRVNAVMVEPVASEEFWRILLRRLFKSIDRGKGERLAVELRGTYESHRDVFGDEAVATAERLKQTYPLHPGFVDVLRLVIERNPQLQKTRDALKIARIILRGLYERSRGGGLVEELVMPWHIDPRRPGVAGLILRGYDAYKAVVDTDIVANIDSKIPAERRGLARILAITVFLKTYVFDIQFYDRASRVFPTAQEAAVLAYEPGLFQARNWLPADIPVVLGELSRSLYYMWSDGERYWFWYIANINEIVEKRARELLASRAPVLLEELTQSEDFLRGLTRRSLSSQRRGLWGRYERRLFEDVLVFVDVGLEDVPDDERYKLVVAWRPRGVEGFEKIVSHVVRGGKTVRRNYQNTVVVVAPGSERLLEEALADYARVRAADEVLARLDEALPRGIDPRIQKALQSIQRTLVNTAKEEAAVRLLHRLLSGFDRVYYPRDGGVGAADASSVTASNIVEKVEVFLESSGKAILDRVDFDYLSSMLDGVGYSLGEPRMVREVVQVFRLFPGLRMIPRGIVVESLAEAYRAGRLVVVKPDGRIFYARLFVDVEECPSEPASAVRVQLGDDDRVVLASSGAALELLTGYLQGLEGVEEGPGGVLVVREAMVSLGGEVMGLGEFAELASKSPELVEEAVFCVRRSIRRPGVRLRVEPRSLQLVAGSRGSVRARVESVGGVEPGRVKVEAEAPPGLAVSVVGEGIVEPGGVVEVVVEALEPGEYSIVVRAVPEKGEGDEARVSIVVRGGEEEVPCSQARESGVEVTGVSLEGRWDNMEILVDDLAQLRPEAVVEEAVLVDDSAGVRLELTRRQELSLVNELVRSVARSLRDLYGATPRARLVVVFDPAIGSSEIPASLEMLGGDEVECRARIRKSS